VTRATRFAENLRKVRQARGWSQGELARRAHISQSLISGIESGNRGCTDRTMEALAAGLGVGVAMLFAGPCERCGGKPDAGSMCLVCGAMGEPWRGAAR
jgi:transcriptional regulator with XRE-family HTH domain